MKTVKTIYSKQEDCKISIIVTDDIVLEGKKLFKKHKETMEGEQNMKGFVISFDVDHYYILFNLNYIKNEKAKYHEVFHLMEWISRDRAVVDEEAKALLIGYLGEEVSKFLSTINK